MKRLVLFAVLTACGARDDAALLDHARILAVRQTPAHAAPGETARIDVLAGNDAGEVFVAVPDAATIAGMPLVRAADGWYVTAPATPAAPTVEIALTIDDQVWRATKQLVLGGDHADNPSVSTMQVDGADSTEIACSLGATRALAVATAGVEPLTYAWYTSIGKLEHDRRADATFDGDEQGTGTVLAVIRDAQGGVTWQLTPATIQ